MTNTVRIVLILSMFNISGCYAGITGKVVDAETELPIQGVVVLVEWTKAHGFGLTYQTSEKVVEAVTDKDGKVAIPGILDPFVDPPDITVYKKGYVAWNNKYIFPDYQKRKDFKWQNNFILKLIRFEKEKYSYNSHVSFINDVIHSGLALGKKNEINKAIGWEEEQALQERLNRNDKENRRAK